MNVFIVEDSDLMREHLEFMLSEIPGIEVIGHAVDEHGAVERINSELPDLVILDLNLQSGSGIDVLKNIKEHHASIKVMVLTNYTDEIYVSRCMTAGADYFFDKSFQFMRVGAVLRQMASSDAPAGKTVAWQ